ncbi:MAG: tetratricopeptide repeat protein [Woeseiaceae bacterium]
MGPILRNLLFAIPILWLAAACSGQSQESTEVTGIPAFVGSDQCAACHTTEYGDWRGSHHALAMQVANEETVLGDFSDASLEYFGTTTQFVRDRNAFLVRTENAEGKIQNFTVTHTFGIEPLQQYLVEFPGGRKQALTYAWDTRSAEAGGQRWYHLYPDEYIGPDDPLHWTRRYFNWNYMCAECHSTNVKLGYDIESDSFHTTFDEISVGCEACHGPASEHIAQAQTGPFSENFGLPVDLDDRGNSSWIMNVESGIASRSEPMDQQQQPESCGRCHSRRSVLAAEYEYGKPLTDTHSVSLIEENLYHPDGRIQDEVYVYGSFLQSKMYAAGVSCSDCHNPHSGDLLAGPDPNSVCSQCHLPTIFATTEHSGSDSVACVNCHMPATTYMGVDDRRDHSFRLPNTATDPTHYGTAIAAGRDGLANVTVLNALKNTAYPAIAQATLLTLLAPTPGESEYSALTDGLNNADPLVRIAALRTLRRFPPEYVMRSGSHLLRDPVRGVRREAALTYVDLRDLLPVEDARAFAAAADEYREALLTAASMPEPVTMLAEFEYRTGNDAAADAYLQHALRLDPDSAVARHSYGLSLVRKGRPNDALEQLRLAAETEPTDNRFVYVYGVALSSLGLADDAISVLSEARNDFPENYEIAWGLATMLRDNGDLDGSRSLARDMLSLYPDDTNFSALLQSLPATD